MPRLVLAAISAILLLGYSTYAGVTTWVFPSNAPLKTTCDAWLDHPGSGWISLRGCALDVNLLILESEQGDLETLENRKNNLSSRPYPSPPRWVAAWIPIKSTWKGRTGLVHAVYRLEARDALEWLNEFERADDQKKDRMWADPAPIVRLSRPGVLPGKADKPSTESLMKLFGPRASPNLMAVIAGDPPPLGAPVLGIFSGLFGVLAIGYLTRRRPASEDLTAEQLITNANVSDVKLELGALEELRREERATKREDSTG